MAFLRRGRLEEEILQELLTRKAEEEESLASLKYHSLVTTVLRMSGVAGQL